jgi:hypothetical protein
MAAVKFTYQTDPDFEDNIRKAYTQSRERGFDVDPEKALLIYKECAPRMKLLATSTKGMDRASRGAWIAANLGRDCLSSDNLTRFLGMLLLLDVQLSASVDWFSSKNNPEGVANLQTHSVIYNAMFTPSLEKFQGDFYRTLRITEVAIAFEPVFKKYNATEAERYAILHSQYIEDTRSEQ